MAANPNLILGAISERLANLRFPTLFLLLAGLFLFDLLIPDFIPFFDEIVLGIATLIVGSLTRPGEKTEDQLAP